MNNSNSQSAFTIKTSNADFLKRKNDVFDKLNIIEKNFKNNQNSEIEEMEIDRNEVEITTNTTNTFTRKTTKHFRGKESIFKVPQDPMKKNFLKNLPDFKKNPHKWIKYSLDDVKEEDMSDRSNTKAAMSFLKELEVRKSLESNEKIELPKKIIFNKRNTPELDGCNKVNEDAKSTFRSSKVVMPEYVVGQKAKKEKKNKSIKSAGSKQLKLDHLFEEEDD